VKPITIFVRPDPDCSAPSWWTAARESKEQPATFTRLEVGGGMRLTLKGAHALFGWARELPGWDQPDPMHPHPILWQVVDHD